MAISKYNIHDDIPSNEFEFTHNKENIHDTKFETKPVGWFEDSVKRFAKNKASVVAACIIVFIALFAIIVPIASPKNHVNKSDFPNGFQDKEFANVLPKLFNHANGFWDGTQDISLGSSEYKLRSFTDSNYDFFDHDTVSSKEVKIGSNIITTYYVKQDTYAVGTKTVTISASQYQKLLDYEAEKGISFSASEENHRKSIIKPVIDYMNYTAPGGELDQWLISNGQTGGTSTILDNIRKTYQQNQSYYFKLIPTKRNNKFSDTGVEPLINSVTNEPESLYMKDSSGNLVFYEMETAEYKIRVDYYDYFTYHNGFAPNYIFGANQYGQDILLRISLGARFSLLLGIGISLINFLIGLIWGAVSGYYGGKVDLVMERVTDIIANVPTIIIMTIAQIQLTNNVALKSSLGAGGTIILAILIAFVYNGWVGVASTTRMQFYRFKGQEYVLASRTLGAKDRRLIFKHILPNAVGTLVTSCVLMIPGVIFSESSLSYLGIINFSTSGICSIGALLNEGQQAGLGTYPHILLFPAIVISLLMISFNLFGNGLRDAFNTTLRGSED